MNRALDVTGRQERKGITRIDRERAVLGLDPLPLAGGVVLDLERGDGLAEEQRPRTEVTVALHPELPDLLVLFWRVLGILHVT